MMKQSGFTIAPWHAILLSLMLTGPHMFSLAALEKVADIGSSMWSEMKYKNGCYKLLNSTGSIGCEAPGGSLVTGILAWYPDIVGGLTEDRVIVVAMADFDALLQRVLGDAAFATHVKGILVDPRVAPPRHSSAPQFPSAEYAPYFHQSEEAATYPWNPAGSGMARHYFPFPVFTMTDVLAADSVWRAQYNNGLSFLNAAYHKVDMALTMDATANSSHCMNTGTCQPVGGFSTWTSIPPLNGTTSDKPMTLVIAQVDSNGFFHDEVQAADSPMSGLIAMLAAIQILVQAKQWPSYTRNLAFAALAGEPWDYMGSRRMLWDMERGTPETVGLNMSYIDQVIEVGQVGKASLGNSSGVSRLFTHAQRGAGYGNTSALESALGLGAAMTNETNVTFTAASASNPGIPPSSLMSFLRVKPSISGVVINEFDTHYVNRYYQSEYDFSNGTSLVSITATAMALARALHLLASGGNASAVTPLNISVRNTTALVADLFVCLIQDSPGLGCGLSRSLITPGFVTQDGVTSYAVRRYISVLPYIPPDPQDPERRADVFRFLYNLMGILTYIGDPGAPCAPKKALCNSTNQVCIKWLSGTTNPDTMGRCLNTTAFYVPAVSTKFLYGVADNYYGWHLRNFSWTWEQEYGWPEDPMWTESNWPATTPYVRVYQSEAYIVEVAVIVSGVLLTAATVVVSYVMRAAYEKQLKSQ